MGTVADDAPQISNSNDKPSVVHSVPSNWLNGPALEDVEITEDGTMTLGGKTYTPPGVKVCALYWMVLHARFR